MASKITTDAQCRAAKPNADGSRKDYSVDRNLQLRVTAKLKVWSFFYRNPSDGKQDRITIGDYPTMGLADARQKAGALRQEVTEGKDPKRERKARKEALTFRALANDYMERHSKLKKTTWEDDESRLDARIFPDIGDYPANEVTKDDVIRIVDEHAKSSTAQADKTKALISSIYNWGQDENLVSVNPANHIRPRYKRVRRTRVFDSTELRALWGFLNDPNCSETEEMGRDVIKLAILLGQRRRQISGAMKAELHDLGTDRASWLIPRKRNKNKQDLHEVPLPPLAAKIFADAMKRSTSAYVFQSQTEPGKPMHADTVSDESDKACKELGIEGASLHTARHTVKTGLSKLKVPKDIRNRITSHTSSLRDAGEWYDHNDFYDEKLEALTRWERRLLDIVSGEAR